MSVESSTTKRIFVGGIPVRVERQDIIAFFSKFGTVKHCKLKKNSKTGRSVGYAYITFEREETAFLLTNKQIEAFDRIIECKLVLKSKQLKESIEEEKRRKLLVWGIPTSTTNEQINEAFSSIMPISHAYVVHEDKSCQPSVRGFVVFLTEKDLDLFLRARMSIEINNVRVHYSSNLYIPKRKLRIRFDAIKPAHYIQNTIIRPVEINASDYSNSGTIGTMEQDPWIFHSSVEAPEDTSCKSTRNGEDQSPREVPFHKCRRNLKPANEMAAMIKESKKIQINNRAKLSHTHLMPAHQDYYKNLHLDSSSIRESLSMRNKNELNSFRVSASRLLNRGDHPKVGGYRELYANQRLNEYESNYRFNKQA